MVPTMALVRDKAAFFSFFLFFFFFYRRGKSLRNLGCEVQGRGLGAFLRNHCMILIASNSSLVLCFAFRVL